MSDSLVSELNLLSIEEYLHPFSFSATKSLDLTVVYELFLFLTAIGFFDIYTAPEFEDEVMLPYAIKGIVTDASHFQVEHPGDFEIIDASEIELVTLYKRRAND